MFAVYDNVSTVPGGCRTHCDSLATGGSFATRVVHYLATNTSSTAHARCLNSVENFMTKFDLADRCIVAPNSNRSPMTRAPDRTQANQRIRVAPDVFLARLFDLMAHGVRIAPEQSGRGWRISRNGRQHAGPAWQPLGAFKNAYDHNRALANRSAIEDDVVATALAQFAGRVGRGPVGPGELLTGVDQTRR